MEDASYPTTQTSASGHPSAKKRYILLHYKEVFEGPAWLLSAQITGAASVGLHRYLLRSTSDDNSGRQQKPEHRTQLVR
ncbi:hypothetical protein NDU88_005918 [Pleurodeles waltl]|uniref:Uncharacterized protein n=1 Tax=Pleurodeles waltl TaxID=8319 RepID=A0AAV7N1X6_PLEWA|nr:hypothetical protein NDU88_005918 [Pleurodeles waltl]